MVSKREKYLIGGLLLVGGVGVVVSYLIIPTFDSIMANTGKIAQLELSLLTMKERVQQMENNIKNLKKLKEIKLKSEVREYKKDSFQTNVKIMLDTIVNLSTTNGNDLISLAPWPAPPPPSPPEKVDAQGNPIPSQVPKLKTFGYAMIIRGSYESVLGFIASLNDHKELIEVKDIRLENEAGEDRTSGTVDTQNPFKPIKLTLRLALFLQPAR